MALLHAGATAHAYIKVKLQTLPLLAELVKAFKRYLHHLLIWQGLLGDVCLHDLCKLWLGEIANIILTRSGLELYIV